MRSKQCATLRNFKVLAFQSPRSVHRAFVGEGDHHSRHSPTVWRREVDVTLHGGKCHSFAIIEDLDRAFEVRGLPSEAVKVVHNAAVDCAGAQVLKHPLELVTEHLRVESTHVVIHVDLPNVPTSEAGNRPGVLLLTGNTKSSTLAVLRDSCVDAHPHEQ